MFIEVNFFSFVDKAARGIIGINPRDCKRIFHLSSRRPAVIYLVDSSSSFRALVVCSHDKRALARNDCRFGTLRHALIFVRLPVLAAYRRDILRAWAYWLLRRRFFRLRGRHCTSSVST